MTAEVDRLNFEAVSKQPALKQLGIELELERGKRQELAQVRSVMCLDLGMVAYDVIDSCPLGIGLLIQTCRLLRMALICSCHSLSRMLEMLDRCDEERVMFITYIYTSYGCLQVLKL